ncbi:hypothetical protein [Mucilaginibacter sp.]|uniref:hypothetical protein n=1 Tax=Mucilaginibacter sp. TaxID=1882438 RepID=UPI0025D9F1C2|nr:hypothetical protein [Mucilaginibacter sp.]
MRVVKQKRSNAQRLLKLQQKVEFYDSWLKKHAFTVYHDLEEDWILSQVKK